jgi:hypothetical protein
MPPVAKRFLRRGYGEIGRHARFRFWCRKAWEFKSLYPHQSHEAREQEVFAGVEHAAQSLESEAIQGIVQQILECDSVVCAPEMACGAAESAILLAKRPSNSVKPLPAMDRRGARHNREAGLSTANSK